MLNEILGIEMEVHKKTQSEREGQEIYIKIAKLKGGRIRRKQGSCKEESEDKLVCITETESGHLCSPMWINHRFPLGDLVNMEKHGNTIGKILS